MAGRRAGRRGRAWEDFQPGPADDVQESARTVLRGAIPPELIDSQLFGHEKGSFTGAAEQHQGWFERADGGTLFLDEIGELPLPAQVRLLGINPHTLRARMRKLQVDWDKFRRAT